VKPRREILTFFQKFGVLLKSDFNRLVSILAKITRLPRSFQSLAMTEMTKIILFQRSQFIIVKILLRGETIIRVNSSYIRFIFVYFSFLAYFSEI